MPTTEPNVGVPKLIIDPGKMWAVRLTKKERAELAVSARMARASKTDFVKYLIHAYYEAHVLPDLMKEAEQKRVSVAQLLDEAAESYRPSHAREYHDTRSAGEEERPRKARKTGRAK